MLACKFLSLTVIAALLPACRSTPLYTGPHGPGAPAVIETYQSPLSFCGLLTPGICNADILLLDKQKLAGERAEIALDGGPHQLVVRCLSNTSLATDGFETSIHTFRMAFQPGTRYHFNAKVIDSHCQLAIADKTGGSRSDAVEIH